MKPFLRWAGGKRRLLDELLPRVPNHSTYYEPFAGSATLFFALEPERAVLSDLEPALMQAYVSIAAHPGMVERRLSSIKDRFLRSPDRKAFYYAIRSQFNDHASVDSRGEAWVAAAFVFLNKTCFNGLWRTNRSGRMNVPFGNIKNPKVPSLHEVSDALQVADLKTCGYRTATVDAGIGDFVYFDPPYLGKFSGYCGQFDEHDHIDLVDLLRALDRRGVMWMMSNSDHDLFRDGLSMYRIESVSVRRSISAAGAARGNETEIIVRNY